MSKVIHIGFLFFLTHVSKAQVQTFQKTYKSDSLVYFWGKVLNASDGGFLLGGTGTNLDYSRDFCIVKTDEDGTWLWSKRFNAMYYDGAIATCATTDGYVIAGLTSDESSDVSYLLIIKTDLSGYLIWSKAFDIPYNSYPEKILSTADGGCMLGIVSNDGIANMLKIDSTGNQQWYKTFGNGISLGDVATTNDGGSIMTCSYSYLADSIYTAGILLIKTDMVGDTLWTRTITSPNNTLVSYSIQQTADDGYIMGGTLLNYAGDSSKALLVKANAFGYPEWIKSYHEAYDEQGEQALEVPGEGYVLGGYKSYSGDFRTYVLKTDTLGNLMHAEIFGDTVVQSFFNMLVVNDGGFLISAYSNEYTPGTGCPRLIKTEQTLKSYCHEHTANPIEETLSWSAGAMSLTIGGTLAEVPIVVNSPRTFHEEITLCSSIGIEEEEINALTVFPNPANERLHIAGKYEGSKVRVTDMSGKICLEIKVLENAEIDIYSLTTGMYTICIDNKNRLYHSKFIKE